ncbi:unnamed protein product [Rotaria magnacalcarata]|uniref:EF-hand domain-containing protein n=3 Tax=Rotaria magnacalcarata TaxID=392030 RepID=A0A815DN43_9BILA|nr:unnamed protein product [Rotaria magnacalcarata]CAF1674833.1 unnamed protein product [Rotaria magnacalcarata]CAF1917399.1 unnamed protein product [Rotaria magnacalcarata]CAF2128391.1 unnamed protein product [Rotaria magnacalcarata]CAF2197337.1 unnamed protein product [Rotaria magnacalcarata]
MGTTRSRLADNVYESIAKYTELRRDDINAWEERFLQQCDLGSTTMNKEQFCKFYQDLRQSENVKRLSENVFRAFDLDGDHGISFSEFLIAYVATTEAPLEHKLRYAFNVYDLDHNSMIDRAEILFILHAMFQLLGMNDSKYSYEQCADTIMKTLDINEDQCISKEEFIQGLLKDTFLQSLMNPFQNA